MRIIAGAYRGRRLQAPKGRRTRPTSGRAREAWMSILRDAIPGANVLDLYAGSGALGLEALSRGAARVAFVERDRESLRALRTNIAALGVDDQVSIHQREALAFVRALPQGAFDVTLADPPYDSDAAERLIEWFRAVPFSRILSIEHTATRTLAGDARRQYGSTAITFCYTP